MQKNTTTEKDIFEKLRLLKKKIKLLYFCKETALMFAQTDVHQCYKKKKMREQKKTPNLLHLCVPQ